MTSGFLSLLCIVLLCAYADSQTNCASKIPPDGYWLPSPNCPAGQFYDIPGTGLQYTRCHCWSYCGYICEPKTYPSTTTTAQTTTVPTTPAPTCPMGNYFLIPGPPAYACHCPLPDGTIGYSCVPVTITG